jgi:hypothetical protein
MRRSLAKKRIAFRTIRCSRNVPAKMEWISSIKLGPYAEDLEREGVAGTLVPAQESRERHEPWLDRENSERTDGRLLGIFAKTILNQSVFDARYGGERRYLRRLSGTAGAASSALRMGLLPKDKSGIRCARRNTERVLQEQRRCLLSVSNRT